MARQNINVGSAPNDSTGDPLRTAFQKINNNFTDLYANVGSSNYRFSNNTMTTISGNINIAPPGSQAIVTGSSNQLYVSSVTSSNDQDTGALVVAGGVGIGGDLNVGGMFYSSSAGFGTIDDTPIGDIIPSTGAFTDLTADTAEITTITGGNIISSHMYVSARSDLDNFHSQYSTVGFLTANTIAVVNNGYIDVPNFISGNVNITGGTISGVGVVYTSIENTPIGTSIPNTAVFTTAGITDLVTSNATITSGSINATKIGNSTPSSGAFTTLSSSGATTFTSAADSTSTSTGGVVLSGGMGVSGNINSGGNVTAVGVHATRNGVGTNFQVGDDAWIGDINVVNTLQIMGQQDNTKGYIVFGTGDASSLGRNGTSALTYTGGFTAGAITGSSVSAGTIGNSGTVLYGTLNSSSAAQTNITSLGTLTGLTVSGTANITTINGSLKGPYNGIVGGTTPNIGSFSDVNIIGTLTVPNNDILGNVVGNLTGTASVATTAGTATYASTAGLASAATSVVQAYQGNITGLGTLSNVRVTSTAIVGNLSTNGNITAIGNVEVGSYLTADHIESTYVQVRGGNLSITATHTIGSSLGGPTDRVGRIVWDSGYIYVCVATYDGINPIWRRATLDSF
jgi:hypothetical protein